MNYPRIAVNSKLKIQKFKIGFADNSKLKIQNSKFKIGFADNSKLKTQNSKLLKVFLSIFHNHALIAIAHLLAVEDISLMVVVVLRAVFLDGLDARFIVFGIDNLQSASAASNRSCPVRRDRQATRAW